MSRWDPRAIIVLILAVAVSIAHVLGIAGLAWWGRSLTEAGSEVLIALVGALIAIIAAFVGQRTADPPPPPPPPDPPTPEG